MDMHNINEIRRNLKKKLEIKLNLSEIIEQWEGRKKK